MSKSFSFGTFKILSGSILKLIAVITMLIDHTALILSPQIPLMTAPLLSVGSNTITLYYIMRKIGRLAFPIFCFLIGEGFAHTRNQKRYAFRLFLFAFISEIPYNFMKGDNLFYIKSQNIFFTLFLGVLLLYIFENINREFLKGIAMLLICGLAVILKPDYGLSGTLLILLMHVLRHLPAVQAVLAYPFLSGGLFSLAAFIPINMYNKKRGFIHSTALKYLFYLFYPLHITVLLIIKLVLSQ